MYMQEKFVEGNKRNLTLATSAECKWAHFIEYPHMLLEFLVHMCMLYNNDQPSGGKLGKKSLET